MPSAKRELSPPFDWDEDLLDDSDDEGTRVFNPETQVVDLDAVRTRFVRPASETHVALQPDDLYEIEASFEAWKRLEVSDVLERVRFVLGGLRVNVPREDGRWTEGIVLCAHPSGRERLEQFDSAKKGEDLGPLLVVGLDEVDKRGRYLYRNIHLKTLIAAQEDHSAFNYFLGEVDFEHELSSDKPMSLYVKDRNGRWVEADVVRRNSTKEKFHVKWYDPQKKRLESAYFSKDMLLAFFKERTHIASAYRQEATQIISLSALKSR